MDHEIVERVCDAVPVVVVARVDLTALAVEEVAFRPVRTALISRNNDVSGALDVHNVADLDVSCLCVNNDHVRPPSLAKSLMPLASVRLTINKKAEAALTAPIELLSELRPLLAVRALTAASRFPARASTKYLSCWSIRATAAVEDTAVEVDVELTSNEVFPATVFKPVKPRLRFWRVLLTGETPRVGDLTGAVGVLLEAATEVPGSSILAKPRSLDCILSTAVPTITVLTVRLCSLSMESTRVNLASAVTPTETKMPLPIISTEIAGTSRASFVLLALDAASPAARRTLTDLNASITSPEDATSSR